MADVLSDSYDVAPEGGTYAPGTGTPDMPQSSGFSFGDFASSLGSTLGGLSLSDLSKALGLGLGGLNIYQGIQGATQLGRQTGIAERAGKLQGQLAGKTADVAAPLTAFSGQELNQAALGKIPAPIQAQIDQWKAGARQQVMDYAARSGLGNSEWLTNRLAWVDQQAQAMMASALEQEQALGIQAGGTAGQVLGTAAGAAGGAAQTASGQQDSLSNLIGQANQMLAQLTAGAT